jgi:cyclic beta-1,2-glucan synthetase
VAAARVHRWTRGDWQLLPFLLPFTQHADLPLRAINRWKMFDNLRRSLVAPMSLLLLLVVLALGANSGITPMVALGLVGAAFLAGPLMGAVAGFSPSRDDLGLLPFYRQALTDLLRALCGGAWLLVQLLHHALRAIDAIGRALYRLAISHRLLLQWTTAAAAQAQAQLGLRALARQHAPTTILAVALAGVLLLLGTPAPIWTLMLCALWAASPVWTWFLSRPRGGADSPAVSGADAVYLHGVARDTWRLFERCITPEDNHLPPDNLQVLPHDLLARRTSPTNIGLYLLGACCARQFGWIGSAELMTRVDATLATLETMQRHRGHFFNWYDTATTAPLLPLYVSTVDSGNLSGHLLAVAEALLALGEAPLDPQASQRALAASRARIAPLLALQPDFMNSRPALAQVWADDSGPLDAAEAELARLQPTTATGDDAPTVSTVAHSPLDELSWLLADHLATLRSVALDRDADAAALSANLRAAAVHCKQLAWAPDYNFLYHRKRHLLHIGYRVAEQTLDASFYDLLASESRLTSVLAIAKGDVPVQHWASLGRPFFAVGMHAGLRSWSGSMFEYLMPTLVLNEPDGSVLHDACRAALHEQRVFVEQQQLPWGISESAYAGQDHTLAYQYAPQGVPRLALRRTPPDELVIAPYATALAAQIDPMHASRNFALLEKMGARGRYGFIEALDFSAPRQTGNASPDAPAFVPVATFMAHHQGMSIVALANVLLDDVAQRWGMGNAHVEAVGSLLHERAPREISKQGAPPPALPEHAAAARRAPGMLRELLPGMAAVEPTHLLSNGRYAVSLRPNGAGRSRWQQFGINRWRDDALRDEYGSFFYVRWAAQPQAVSLTQHPAPDPAAHYQSHMHADRMCFDTHWAQAQPQAHITVWVSPEDDIEFRRVELRNGADQALEIELISSFEVSLADPRADEAHPAFSNMFVSAEWLAAAQALLFKRQARLANEASLYAAHFLAELCPQISGLSLQTDRQRLLGRNASASTPQLTLDRAGSDDGPLHTGLDPVCSLAVRLRIEPNAKATLTFATAASDQSATLRAVIDKYRQPSHVQRASLMSATLAGIRHREMGLSPEYFAAQQSLSTALLFTLARPGLAVPPQALCDRRLLWRLSLSGERPILLVSLDSMQGFSLVRGLAQALRVWAWGGVACDLVVVNGEPASYQMDLQRELLALRERHVSQAQDGARFGNVTVFTLLRADELSPGEQETLHALARLHFVADGRPLTRHVQDWLAAHQAALETRQAGSVTALLPLARSALASAPSQGSFEPGSGEFHFKVTAQQRPQRPWINVLANPDFGAQVSESGGGFSWAVNSRLMQLTTWSNDPVADPASETFLLQDVESREAWSLAASALAADETYAVRHGQGSSSISHQHGALDITVTWWVAEGSAVKRVRVQVINRGIDARRLRIVGIIEWLMGANRGDRAATLTALHTQGLAHGKLSALLCTQTDHSAGFGGGTAFFAMAEDVGNGHQAADWTTDRRECFDARGRLSLPDHFGQQAGAGLDPCAALASTVELPSGGSAERVFLLGYAATPDAARQLATESAVMSADASLAAVGQHWDAVLGASTVSTPDPLFDALVNRWLLYQTLSCRLMAKAAFYQAGGATGFRDQLQDAMALTWAAPEVLRAQVLRCAARQFAEGDVQHWWHAPTGAGVRTHFSDDLLWLPLACLRYLHATDDSSLLDEPVPFLVGLPIPDGAEDLYYTPAISEVTASVYEHAARSIDRNLQVGAHGLPLIGSGDWNDGMNRVGIGGKGESVWLAWFLCAVVDGFAPLAGQRGDVGRAQRWRSAADGWRRALMGQAWDGQWFKRAFFDDGSPLGTHANPEARIDLIAQAWAVLSKGAPAHLQRMAMAAVRSQLFDADAGLIRLLNPPLQNAVPSAGYIQAYPPGVRENGGQYSHAGVWALMAQAQHANSLPDPTERQRGADLAWRYFTSLSPAHRAADPKHGPAYAIEPYVMAGDVYSQPPYVGRGGWSWYTGAAGWLHRAAVESIFGLDQQADNLSFRPCLPSHWPRAELSLRRDGRVMRFILIRAKPEVALAAAGAPDAVLLRVGEVLAWKGLDAVTCFVVPLA